MIGLDSNVIVRYFAQDHAQQSLLASQLIDALTPDNPAFISTVALVETVWVLQRAYKVPQTELAGIVAAQHSISFIHKVLRFSHPMATKI